MSWMRFEHQEGSTVLGTVEGGWMQPVAARSMQEVIRGESTDPAGDSVAVEEVRPLALLRPGKIVAVGGRTGRFDDVVGNGWAALGRPGERTSPAEAGLSSRQPPLYDAPTLEARS